MNITITPTRLAGTITPPPSKSQAHRAIIAGAMACGESKIDNLAESQDIMATRRCMKGLRASTPPVLDCGESGSTLRFLIPVALMLHGVGRFTGSKRLMERPQEPYFAIFREKNVDFLMENGVLSVEGTLSAGVYHLRGDVSSQFITGLLYALPLAEGDSEIVLTTPLESKGYVDMTLDVLGRFGIRVENRGYQTFFVPGGQVYLPCDLRVESDYSQAAFWLVANGLGNQVDITGMNPQSVQGDMVILDYVNKLNQSGEVTLDASQCPDLVPALAARACLRENMTTHIVNAGRLRIKESDRLDTVTTELCKLGARITQTEDALAIHGVASLTGGTVEGHNDHRIAMMLAVAATRASGPVTIEGAECVEKSYPNFWEDYVNLGGVLA